MANRSKWAVAAAVVVALAGAAAAWMFAGNEDAAMALKPDDAAVVAQGSAIYASQCASCHGKNLEGQPNWRQRLANGRLPAPPHDATGHTWHHPDPFLVYITKKGPQAIAGADYASDMPAFEGKLSDAEIVAALSYIKSTWPENVRQHHDMINERARAQAQ